MNQSTLTMRPIQTVSQPKPSKLNARPKTNMQLNSTPAHFKSEWPLKPTSTETGFTVSVAQSPVLRAQANQLVHNAYVQAGYYKEEAISSEAISPLLFTILIHTSQGTPAATVSLAFDGPCGLPCDEAFNSHLTYLRGAGRKVVEVTRLAIAPQFVKAKLLLVRLFNFIYINARKIEGVDDFVVEVSPGHGNYYRRLLCFSPLGSPRPCPRVQGSIACMLRLDLSHSENEIEVYRRNGRNRMDHGRSLYPYFYDDREEQEVTEFINNNS